jgi:hypothetical protein
MPLAEGRGLAWLCWLRKLISLGCFVMAARLTPTALTWHRLQPPLTSLGALLAAIPFAVVALAVASSPAHAGGDGNSSFPFPGAATTAQQHPQPSAQTVARAYPAPVRQAYPYPSNRVPQPLPLGQPEAFPITMDPLAVCPSNLLTFLTSSTNRAVPLWVAARSCDCYAQERAEGGTQDVSRRRCFP